VTRVPWWAWALLSVACLIYGTFVLAPITRSGFDVAVLWVASGCCAVRAQVSYAVVDWRGRWRP
jgi:hypothetical protein